MIFILKSKNKLAIVEPTVSDAKKIANLYNEVYDSKYPLLEFLKPLEIEKMISKCLWRVAYIDDKLIGSAVGTPSKWNNSLEFGKGAIHKDYWGKHIGTKISKEIIEEGVRKGFDIIWGTPRNKPVHKVVSNLGMVLTGYLPGAHYVEFREIHLLSVLLSKNAKKKRVAPIESSKNKIYQLPAVKRVINELNLKNIEDEYPNNIIVGPKSKTYTKIGFNYRPGDNSLIINSIEGSRIIDTDYIEVNVLTDKLDIIELFNKFGFHICAFLPGWYGTDKRYDCVKLAKCFKELKVADPNINNLVEKLYEEFNDK